LRRGDWVGGRGGAGGRCGGGWHGPLPRGVLVYPNFNLTYFGMQEENWEGKNDEELIGFMG
jgi:hypothetical protein